MDKSIIVRFLKENKRGVYDLIATSYTDLVLSMKSKMAQVLIQEDLQKLSEEKIELNYFSLNRAISKVKRSDKSATKSNKQWSFKDDHEIKDQSIPGKFKID